MTNRSEIAGYKEICRWCLKNITNIRNHKCKGKTNHLLSLSRKNKSKVEVTLLNRVLYIGEEIPDSLVKDKRTKCIFLGTPAEIIKELNNNEN